MQNILRQSRFETLHFNRSSVTVNRNSIDIQSYLGIALSDLQIAGLSGAPTGSNIEVFEVTQDMADKEEDDVPPGLYFRVRNRAYIRDENRVGIYEPANGAPDELRLYMDLVDFLPGKGQGSKVPRGVGARMLGNIVREARGLGYFTRIRLLAAGGRLSPDRPDIAGARWGGYAVWPQYGFDAPIDDAMRAIFPQFPFFPRDLANCSSVLDVLSLEQGKAYWKEVGTSAYMEFDLSPMSKSMRLLDDFLATPNYA